MIHLEHTYAKALFFVCMKFRLTGFPIFDLATLCQASTKTLVLWPLAPLKGEGVAGKETHGATLLPSESPICLWTLPGAVLFLFTPSLASQNVNVPPQSLTGLVVSQGALSLSALPSHREAPSGAAMSGQTHTPSCLRAVPWAQLDTPF